MKNELNTIIRPIALAKEIYPNMDLNTGETQQDQSNLITIQLSVIEITKRSMYI